MDMANAIRHVEGVDAPLQDGILAAVQELGFVTTDHLARLLDRPKASVQTTVYKLAGLGQLGAVKSRDPKRGAIYGLPEQAAKLRARLAERGQPSLAGILSEFDVVVQGIVQNAIDEIGRAFGPPGGPDEAQQRECISRALWRLLDAHEGLRVASEARKADGKDAAIE